MSRIILQKNIPRLMAVLLVLLLLVGLAPHALAAGGSCGENLTWSLEGGTLTITGSGAMTDFPESTMAPWYAQRQEILRLVLPEGLTAIGDLAFYECTNLVTVTIPDSVTAIGSYAFAGCTGMTMLHLGSGVKTIGASGFSDCVSLTGLTLPGSLQSIGLEGFYRCESIPTLVIPASVQSLGKQAFGYCKNLVSVDIRANITQVPEWLFYGCEKLSTVSLPDTVSQVSEFSFRACDQLSVVYYNGSSMTPEQIQAQIGAGEPSFDGSGQVTGGSQGSMTLGGSTVENDDGTFTQENTTVNSGENATVSSTVTTVGSVEGTGDTDHRLDITVNISGSNGWDEAKDAVNGALSDYSNLSAANQSSTATPNINIFVQNSQDIDQDFINAFAGRDVNITITTQDGSVWKLKGSELVEAGEEDTPGYDLRYALTPGSQELCQELGVAACYTLNFLTPAQINAEVLFRLDLSQAFQNATLLQKNRKEFSQIQTTVVDADGYAHFYLGAVDDKTEYCIAINLPQPEQEAIIPDTLNAAYGSPEQVEPIIYEITGRESSWGMDIKQVTFIMIGVLVGVVVIVGVVMFTLNKRKLKAGYMPDLDDEDPEKM